MTQYFWPEDFRVNDLVAELVRRGHDVQVLTGNPNYPTGRFFNGYGGIRPTREEAFGSRIVRVPLSPRRRGTGRDLLFNYFSFAASASAVGPTMIRGPLDAVLAYEPSPVTVAFPALALARTKRAPALMWIQDLWPDTLAAMGIPAPRLLLNATARLHRAMDGLLVQSRAFTEPLRQHGVCSERIHYVPNWAEDRYCPVEVAADAPERRELPAGFKILFAGNLGAAQNLEVLVGASEALRGVPDLHWIVLGSGRQAGWLTREVKERGLHNVHLLGRRPVESMPTWFALADVLLATLGPDPVYSLTLPSKLQTYLACGKPILAALDGEGARVVRESGAGMAVAPGDANALACAARQLYDNGPLSRAEMGLRGLTYYREHFDRTNVIDSVEAVLYSFAATQNNTAALC